MRLPSNLGLTGRASLAPIALSFCFARDYCSSSVPTCFQSHQPYRWTYITLATWLLQKVIALSAHPEAAAASNALRVTGGAA